MTAVVERARARAGDRFECPGCHRMVGYWPDKLDYHIVHLMAHRVTVGLYGRPTGEWCEVRRAW